MAMFSSCIRNPCRLLHRVLSWSALLSVCFDCLVCLFLVYDNFRFLGVPPSPRCVSIFAQARATFSTTLCFFFSSRVVFRSICFFACACLSLPVLACARLCLSFPPPFSLSLLSRLLACVCCACRIQYLIVLGHEIIVYSASCSTM